MSLFKNTKVPEKKVGRIIRYIELWFQNVFQFGKTYVKPAQYKWHLMQTRDRIKAEDEMSFECRSLEIMTKYRGVKLHFFYASYFGECLMRMVGIDKDEEYRKQDDCYHVYIPNVPIANKQLLIMFSAKHELITKENIQFWEYFFINHCDFIYTTDYERYRHPRLGIYKLKAGEAIVDLTNFQEKEAEELLAEMGLANKKFICIHSRDAKYRRKHSGHENQTAREHRNCDIENYFKAAEFAYSKGLAVVRMGYRVEKEVTEPYIFDYASLCRDELMDLYLQKKCEYYIGCSAGLFVASAIFGTPRVLANLESLSLGGGDVPYTDYDILLPLKYWDSNQERYLTFQEMLEIENVACGNGDYFYYIKKGITAVQNSADEILEATIELHESLEGTYVYDDEDIYLQKLFNDIVESYIIKTIGADKLGVRLRGKIGAKFLKENRDLFGDYLVE